MPRKRKDIASPESTTADQMSAPTTAVVAKPKHKGGRPKGSKNKPTVKKARGRMRYDAATKAKIIAVTKGKKLAVAHAAAKKVGYKGSAASLYQMLYALKGKKRGRPAMAAKWLGRPRKAASTAQIHGIKPIEQLVDQLVRERVRNALNDAIKALSAVKR